MRPRLSLLLLPPLDATAEGPEPLGNALGPYGWLGDRRPDAILCCGLTTDATADALRHAHRGALKLLNDLDLPAARLFLAPGPGDCDAAAIGPLRNVVGMLPPAAIFGTPAQVEFLFKGFTGFAQQQATFGGGTPSAKKPWHFRRTHLRKIAVGVLAFNSVWVPGPPQTVGVEAAAVDLAELLDADLRIVLAFHAPTAWRPEDQAALPAQDVDLVLSAPERPVWIEVFDDFALQTSLPDGAPVRLALRRPLPPPERDPAPAGTEPRDLFAYLDQVEREWGQLAMAGLVEGSDEVAPQGVSDIYVPLRTSAPRHATSRLAAYQTNEKDPQTAIKGELKWLGCPDDDRAVEHAIARLESYAPQDDGERWTVMSLWELEQAIAASPRLLIEGAPGSGKSTTLHALTLALVQAHRGEHAAARRFGLSHPYPIPVLVTFRAFWRWLVDHPSNEAPFRRLEIWLTQTVAPAGGDDGWMVPALRAGRIFLMLDGLDELPGGLDREVAIRAARDCIAQLPGRFVVASRPAGLDAFAQQALAGIPNLARATVRPFDRDQIAAFLRVWFPRLRPGTEGERSAEELLATLRRRGWLNDPESLAATPITLMVLALVGLRGPLPELRAELYDQCVTLLCDKWDWKKTEASEHLRGALSLTQKRRVLQAVAWLAMKEGTEQIRIGPLLDAVCDALRSPQRPELCAEDCRPFVEHLAERSGLLIPDTPFWRFRHRTFLEFLAARHLCDVEKDSARVLAGCLHKPEWHEVTLLALGHTARTHGAGALKLLDALAAEARMGETAHDRANGFARVAAASIDLRAFRCPS